MSNLPRFLDVGSPLATSAIILRRNQNVRFQNPEKLGGEALPIGTFGRIHSHDSGVYTVWLLDESNSQTIMLDVPLGMMGTLFRQHPHGIFPHLGR